MVPIVCSPSLGTLRLRVDVGVQPQIYVLAVDLEARLLIAARRGHDQCLAAGTRCRRLDGETDHERVTLSRNCQVVRHCVSLLVARLWFSSTVVAEPSSSV